MAQCTVAAAAHRRVCCAWFRSANRCDVMTCGSVCVRASVCASVPACVTRVREYAYTTRPPTRCSDAPGSRSQRGGSVQCGTNHACATNTLHACVRACACVRGWARASANPERRICSACSRNGYDGPLLPRSAACCSSRAVPTGQSVPTWREQQCLGFFDIVQQQPRGRPSEWRLLRQHLPIHPSMHAVRV